MAEKQEKKVYDFGEKKEEVIKPSSEPKNSSFKAEQAFEDLDKDVEEKRQAEYLDIQKELEAKFDELFGSIDDNDNE